MMRALSTLAITSPQAGEVDGLKDVLVAQEADEQIQLLRRGIKLLLGRLGLKVKFSRRSIQVCINVHAALRSDW
jgi:hypothetical protein